MKVVIYARYSTDKQSESSIDDQIRLCMVRVEFEKWTLKDVYQDEGVSGSVPVAQRSGGVRLLADSMAKSFDVLVLEGLDRLSRDLVEQETIVRRLEHRGIRILGLSDGYDSNQKGRQMIRGMRGIINEMYLEDLKAKTHRGMSGQVARGFAAGGAAYGYVNLKGEQGSTIAINEDQAEWVRWIFQKCADGWSFINIVRELNRLAVPSPRGSTWGVSGIYGSPKKGCGILNNDLYIGRYIWNRSQWVKDPDTGKRIRVERPESEWMVEEVPHLRIIDQELWDKVRDRFETSRLKGGLKGRGKRTSTLLGGLLTCGHCDGTVTAVNAHSYGCSNHKYKGPEVCSGVSISKKIAERRLLALVRDVLLSPELVTYVYTETRKQLKQIVQTQGQSKKELLRRVESLEGEIEKYIDAIGKIGISEALTKKLKAAEAEKANCLEAMKFEAQAFDMPKKKDIEKRYKELVMDMQNALAGDTEEARAHIKELMGCVKLMSCNKGVYAELEASQPILLKTAGMSPEMVAGAGFVFKKQYWLKMF